MANNKTKEKYPMDVDTGLYKICKILDNFTCKNQQKILHNANKYIRSKQVKKWIREERNELKKVENNG